MNHLVSDYIIRLKNASRARLTTVTLPYSKLGKAIGDVLVKEGFLTKVKEDEKDGKKMITATLNYHNRKPVLTDVAVVSKPSLRVYSKAKNVPTVEARGMVVSIVTTSKGVMTSREAKEKGVGGELLFRIW